MSQNPPRFGDAPSVEEHVLGCMCDSFRSWAGTKERKLFPVSMIHTGEYDRIEKELYSIQYLKKKENLSIRLCMKFMVSIGANPITSI